MPANDIPTRAERILQYKKDIREAEREKKRYMQAIEEKRKQLDRMDNPFEGQYLFDKYMAMSEEEDANYVCSHHCVIMSTILTRVDCCPGRTDACNG